MEQGITITDSKGVKIIQAKRDVYYYGAEKPVNNEEGTKKYHIKSLNWEEVR